MVSDINECVEMNGGCQQLCFNTDGSRLCSCKNGYILNSDGYSCDGEYHTQTTSYFLFLVFLFVFNWSDTLLSISIALTNLMHLHVLHFQILMNVVIVVLMNVIRIVITLMVLISATVTLDMNFEMIIKPA